MIDAQSIEAGTHVAAIGRTERIFLWSMRAWAACHLDVDMIWPCLERAFAQEGMRCALTPFHEFMSAVFAGLDEWPDIRCVHAPRLGKHEAVLLTALAQLQQGQEFSARQLLQSSLQQACLRHVIRHGSACVQGARVAGLRFASPQAHQPAMDAATEHGLPACAVPTRLH